MPIVTINRRRLLKTASALVAAPAILRVTRASAQDATFKIGFVSPQTGPIAGFGEADGYILEGINKAFAGGIDNNGKKVAVEIIAKDSQSNPNRAAEVATELILQDKVNLIVASATPDTTNPVADQAELNEVPCITDQLPLAALLLRPRRRPGEGLQMDLPLLLGPRGRDRQLPRHLGPVRRRQEGGRPLPERCRRQCLGRSEAWPARRRWPQQVTRVTDPGRYQPLNNDFSSQISAFKDAGCEIVTGVMIPPDFATFWSQAAQQGFNPKVATIGKALALPLVDRSPGRSRRRADDRDLVVAEPSLLVQSHRAECQGTGRWLHCRHRQAVDPAHRLQPRALRSGRRRDQARGGYLPIRHPFSTPSPRPTSIPWSGR